eukprot:scaffold168727_cov36-Attheya_sp.AAC.1
MSAFSCSIDSYQETEWNCHKIHPNAPSEKLLSHFCEPGYVPYRFVRNQLKGFSPDTWIMDTKTITNFLVKCRLHKKEILEGCAVTIDEDEPGWMKVVGADNSDHISWSTNQNCC